MIQIKFIAQSDNIVKTKKIQFSKNHEKNLETIYEITREAIGRKEKSELEELIMICCFHIVKEIRKNTVTDIIQDRLLKELFTYQSTIQTLKNIKKISVDAKIDDIPKKNLEISFRY